MEAYPARERYNAEDLIRIVALLRDPVSGCPWDSVQTHQSIRKNFLEETYEVLEAIDADDPAMLQEELGDVMMQVALHSCMEEEKGNFSFDDVCDTVCRKLIYRHPHIFLQENGQSGGLNDWDALKNKEKGRTGLADELATVPVTLPALMKAQKTQKRAERYHAVSADAETARTEMCTAYAALCGQMKQAPADAAEPAPACAEAGGAFLFAAANWLRCCGLDAEEVLEKQIARFHAANGGKTGSSAQANRLY